MFSMDGGSDGLNVNAREWGGPTRPPMIPNVAVGGMPAPYGAGPGRPLNNPGTPLSQQPRIGGGAGLGQQRGGGSSSRDGKQMCKFFASGGCTRDDCPFSHDLTVEAPEGVDVSAGFILSGNVANAQNASPAQVRSTGGVGGIHTAPTIHMNSEYHSWPSSPPAPQHHMVGWGDPHGVMGGPHGQHHPGHPHMGHHHHHHHHHQLGGGHPHAHGMHSHHHQHHLGMMGPNDGFLRGGGGGTDDFLELGAERHHMQAPFMRPQGPHPHHVGAMHGMPPPPPPPPPPHLHGLHIGAQSTVSVGDDSSRRLFGSIGGPSTPAPGMPGERSSMTFHAYPSPGSSGSGGSGPIGSKAPGGAMEFHPFGSGSERAGVPMFGEDARRAPGGYFGSPGDSSLLATMSGGMAGLASSSAGGGSGSIQSTAAGSNGAPQGDANLGDLLRTFGGSGTSRPDSLSQPSFAAALAGRGASSSVAPGGSEQQSLAGTTGTSSSTTSPPVQSQGAPPQRVSPGPQPAAGAPQQASVTQQQSAGNGQQAQQQPASAASQPPLSYSRVAAAATGRSGANQPLDKDSLRSAELFPPLPSHASNDPPARSSASATPSAVSTSGTGNSKMPKMPPTIDDDASSAAHGDGSGDGDDGASSGGKGRGAARTNSVHAPMPL